jgi:hypothetical protein
MGEDAASELKRFFSETAPKGSGVGLSLREPLRGSLARIVTRGVRLHCSDPELDHAFVRDVQLRATDLAPFLRRMREIKLEAIKR